MIPPGLNPEHAAVNAAVWGPQAAAYLDELAAATFTDPDPWWSDTRDAVVAVLRRSTSRRFEVGVLAVLVGRELARRGYHPSRLTMDAVTAAGGRLRALGIYLDAMADRQLEQRLRQDLARMADALDRPGGARRVAELIGAR